MPFIFFLIALLYSMAGFGGGSSYLAILSLTDRDPDQVATLALICNLASTSLGVFNFGRFRQIPWNQAVPFLISSIPAAYIGGSIKINGSLHLFLLAMSLSVAGFHLFRGVSRENQRPTLPLSNRKTWAGGLLIGSSLGLLSGVVGIGGGIFLAPLLYALHWMDARKIAGLACFFIFCNSVSGLAGRWMRLGEMTWMPEAGWLLTAVFFGAFAGSFLSSRKLIPAGLRFVTALLVSLVSIRLWIRWFDF